MSEIEIDLRQIQTDPATKDIHPELRGMATSIRSAASDGLAAAQLALDPLQRDRAFGARRTLSEHARVARYVGALSGGLNAMYRRLAKSCDIVSNLILVGCGEAMAQGSVTRSSFVRSVPVSELLARRDAAVNALRNLIGLEEASMGGGNWPRGLVAYRQLVNQMDDGGQSDLRTMFNEGELSARFDQLIDLAASNNLDSMRAVGSVAARSVGLINRLISFSNGAGIQPHSPPLAAFLSALRLFADAFSNTSRGFRLVYIARPPVLSYGNSDGQGNDPRSTTLPQLIMSRNTLAHQLDCLLGCECNTDTVRAQIVFDKLLFEIDRAIDSIGLSEAVQATPRELAAGALIGRIALGVPAPNPASPFPPILTTLNQIRILLGWTGQPANVPDPLAVLRELCMQEEAEDAWLQLVQSLASGCAGAALATDPQFDVPAPPNQLPTSDTVSGPTVTQLIARAIEMVRLMQPAVGGVIPAYDCPSTDIVIPADLEAVMDGFVSGWPPQP